MDVKYNQETIPLHIESLIDVPFDLVLFPGLVDNINGNPSLNTNQYVENYSVAQAVIDGLVFPIDGHQIQIYNPSTNVTSLTPLYTQHCINPTQWTNALNNCADAAVGPGVIVFTYDGLNTITATSLVYVVQKILWF